MKLKAEKRKINRNESVKGSHSFTSSLRQGRSSSWRTWEKIIWCLALVLILTIVVDIYRRQTRIAGLKEEINDIDRGMERNRVEYQRLLLEREFKRSDAFIERYARLELGWLRPGDYY
ncbi:MAG: hypothetical protein FWE76_03605, partial [Symbiobacteriaceae bacterium]|nr:hypothetical protein [Symbiobacteriaceae bacterium]